MAIYAYSPELRMEFRRQHRRKVVNLRARKRREQEERPREVKTKDTSWLDAITRDKDDDGLERS